MTGPVAYTSWSQLRADAWARLEEHARRARAIKDRGESVDWFVESMGQDLAMLAVLEDFWAFPRPPAVHYAHSLLDQGAFGELARLLTHLNQHLVKRTYRSGTPTAPEPDAEIASGPGEPVHTGTDDRPYFEVLIVEDLSREEREGLRAELLRWRRPDDPFIYDVVFAPSAPEALIAAQLNSSIQAVVIRRSFSHEPRSDLSLLDQFQDLTIAEDLAHQPNESRAQVLGVRLAEIRPELDLYLMTEIAVEQMAGELSHHFRRVFHTHEGTLELHLSLITGIRERYGTPFFDALKAYSHRPTGVFHALPISQGKSIVSSDWIGDMVDFYGLDIFMAETSSTGGGLDSLLDPTGPLREAQQKAAETFGARQTYFVTNGTSTANKIVVQALVAPGDIVLVDRNCHKSHHYGLMLAGAHVAYLDAYPLDEYAMFGGVPLHEIKTKLLALRETGQLHRVKMLMLTNCTFDGIVYDVQRVMEECLAIKPDLVFLWDEAWFAFGRFHPLYRSRTAMAVAEALTHQLRTPEYRERYEAQRAALEEGADPLDMRLLPDPDQARVRVYATQSTHKTLTSLRQGSMIHVHDQDYAQMVQGSFHEAYMSHTSTSPNYQILASLDLGRRQAALEGYELVQRQVEYAMRLRDAIDSHPLLSRYMRCLTTGDMIPSQYRPYDVAQPLRTGRQSMVAAWETDEFVLDPSRVTLLISQTGIDGATFKREQLMDRFGIQVNKTSANTVLFMTNIGTTRSSVAYLIEVLVKIARDLDQQANDRSYSQQVAFERAVESQSSAGPALPQFTGFHSAFLDGNRMGGSDVEGDGPDEVSAGDLRAAFYLSYTYSFWQYAQAPEIRRRLEEGEPVVSATFVTPYPPGFPVLVPGQVFTLEILDYFEALDTPEVHGYDAQVGYRILTPEALDYASSQQPARSDTSRE